MHTPRPLLAQPSNDYSWFYEAILRYLGILLNKFGAFAVALEESYTAYGIIKEKIV